MTDGNDLTGRTARTHATASELASVGPASSESVSDDLLDVIAPDGTVAVAIQPEGLLVAGDPSEIEAYVERIRTVAGRTVDVIGVDATMLGSAAGLVAGGTAFLGQSAKFVQLHPESLNAIQKGRLIPGSDGFFRMMTRGADKKFVSQLQWKPAHLTPQKLMSIQMIAVQIALSTAIAEVKESVQRVEGKVEEVLRLAHANRSGDVLGDRVTIERMVHYLDRHGSFSDADWDSIAAIGPALNRTVEQLRHHAARTLESFDATRPIQDRAEFITKAADNNQLGETLNLLVVAQDSLYKWQRLRIARVRATQPEHLQQVLDDARDLVTRQFIEDGALYATARNVLEAVAQTDAIDGFRFWSVQDLDRSLPSLRADLDSFGQARRAHKYEWKDFAAPTPMDAANAALEQVSETASAAMEVASEKATFALEAASDGIEHLSQYLGLGQAREKFKVRKRNKKNLSEESD